MQKLYQGRVVEGDGIAGPVFNTPTANLDCQVSDLETGVYAAFAHLNGERYPSTVCYGVGEPPKFEVYLFDFDQDIYGQELSVEILEKISELIPWESKERLRQKILHDLEMAKEIFQQKKSSD